MIHVSIHDVSPATEKPVADLLRHCAEVGVRPSLLVVPDFHKRAPLNDSFASWLVARAAEGHELFLHGYYHLSDPPGKSMSASAKASRWFRQNMVSANEAEFSSISRDEARARIEQAMAWFRSHSISVSGFIAPAWSMKPWLLPMLATFQLRYSEDHFFVYDTLKQTRKLVPVMNYASRTPSRMLTSLLGSRASMPLAHVGPLRYALHPGDMNILTLRREIAHTLAKLQNIGFANRLEDLLS